ncbi:MAG: RNA polymerase sigma factor [Chloroflexota bacterium]
MAQEHVTCAIEISEEALIEQARSDPEAFGLLYEKYVNKIYTYVYYRTGSHHDAEDLTARTFHRAMHHISGFEQRGLPFSAWLYRIAHNLVANWHRDRSRRKVIALDELILSHQHQSSPESLVEEDEEKIELLRLIRRLPPERQQLLILKFVEGMSNLDIGCIMGRSEGAVKSLYHRTLLALRKEMASRPEKGRKLRR